MRVRLEEEKRKGSGQKGGCGCIYSSKMKKFEVWLCVRDNRTFFSAIELGGRTPFNRRCFFSRSNCVGHFTPLLHRLFVLLACSRNLLESTKRNNLLPPLILSPAHTSHITLSHPCHPLLSFVSLWPFGWMRAAVSLSLLFAMCVHCCWEHISIRAQNIKNIVNISNNISSSACL